jgi:type II secretory pathway pseudopilin PulG
MMRTIMRRRLRESGDEGTSLIEMLVVMIVFTMVMAIVTGAIASMMRQERKETGQSNDLNASRKVLEQLDHTARYANAVTAPGTGTDGNFYVEFQSGNSGQQQTCTQWRYVTTGGLLQWRTWQPPLSGIGSVTATPWATDAVGISKVGTTPIFTVAASSTDSTKEELDVAFTATSGSPPTSSASQLTLTAINSTNSSPPTTATCTQVGRP